MGRRDALGLHPTAAHVHGGGHPAMVARRPRGTRFGAMFAHAPWRSLVLILLAVFHTSARSLRPETARMTRSGGEAQASQGHACRRSTDARSCRSVPGSRCQGDSREGIEDRKLFVREVLV